MNDPSRELQFCTRGLQLDAKNYHTWSYRHWVLTHFYQPYSTPPAPTSQHAKPFSMSREDKLDIWEGEVRFAEGLLAEDVRNNSAWAHRFFVVFENGIHPAEPQQMLAAAKHASIKETIIERELAFARNKIALTPNNASPWNFLRGFVLIHALRD